MIFLGKNRDAISQKPRFPVILFFAPKTEKSRENKSNLRSYRDRKTAQQYSEIGKFISNRAITNKFRNLNKRKSEIR